MTKKRVLTCLMALIILATAAYPAHRAYAIHLPEDIRYINEANWHDDFNRNHRPSTDHWDGSSMFGGGYIGFEPTDFGIVSGAVLGLLATIIVGVGIYMGRGDDIQNLAMQVWDATTGDMRARIQRAVDEAYGYRIVVNDRGAWRHISQLRSRDFRAIQDHVASVVTNIITTTSQSTGIDFMEYMRMAHYEGRHANLNNIEHVISNRIEGMFNGIPIIGQNFRNYPLARQIEILNILNLSDTVTIAGNVHGLTEFRYSPNFRTTGLTRTLYRESTFNGNIVPRGRSYHFSSQYELITNITCHGIVIWTAGGRRYIASISSYNVFRNNQHQLAVAIPWGANITGLVPSQSIVAPTTRPLPFVINTANAITNPAAAMAAVQAISGAATDDDIIAIWLPDIPAIEAGDFSSLVNATVADVIVPREVLEDEDNPPIVYPPGTIAPPGTGTGDLTGINQGIRAIDSTLQNILEVTRDIADSITATTPYPDLTIDDIYIPYVPMPIVPDVPDFEWDFSSIFGNMPNLMDYFPFSIPLDLYNTFRVMSGNMPIEALSLNTQERRELMALIENGYSYASIEPMFLGGLGTPPRFEFDLPEPFNYKIVVDLADFEILIAVIRWGTLMSFGFFLFKITPKFIKW